MNGKLTPRELDVKAYSLKMRSGHQDPGPLECLEIPKAERVSLPSPLGIEN